VEVSRPKTWYEFHASKFEGDTAHLTLEEKGAYLTLLNFHFLHDSIPTDINRIRNILRTSKQNARKILDALDWFFTEKDGLLHPVKSYTGDDNRLPWNEWREIREEIFTRDGHVCAYCGDTDGPHEIDHICPVSRGGSNDPSNLTVACVPCNRSKGTDLWKPKFSEQKLTDG
jgi:5-methylcytosine-specific restriction endonuclease McrA